MADRYNARLDSFTLEIETIEDNFEKAIAKHEFPFKDGALLEDMALKARIIRIRCYFYEATYDTHRDLLKHIEKRELFELLHPKYGLLKGSIESVAVRHDDRTSTAEIDISFVEGKIIAAEPQRQVNVERSTEEAFANGQFELIEEVEEDIRNDLGTEAGDIIIKEIDTTLPMHGQFSGISIKAREYIKAADAFVDDLRATQSAITNPADSLLAVVNYPNTLAGNIIGTVARTIERYAILHEGFRSSPVRFLSTLRTSLGGLTSLSTRFSKYTRIASAQRTALEAAYLYRDDETKREIVRRMETTKSFDALGNYTKPETTEPIMTIGELERSLADVRTDLQAAVDESRGTESLKEMAVSLVEHVNDIKLEREKIVTVEVDPSLPLHLVCLQNNLPYNYAERILSINKIKNPNFTSGEVDIYAG